MIRLIPHCDSARPKTGRGVPKHARQSAAGRDWTACFSGAAWTRSPLWPQRVMWTSRTTQATRWAVYMAQTRSWLMRKGRSEG